MAFRCKDNEALPQAIAENSSTQKTTLGRRVNCYDDTLGWGEFIYLKGVASTAVGSCVTFDEAGLTTLAVANAVGQVGTAMSACVADEYGWYQIYGKGVVKCLASMADNKACHLTATAGSIDDAIVAGDLIVGMVSRSAIDTPATGQCYVQLNYPCCDDSVK